MLASCKPVVLAGLGFFQVDIFLSMTTMATFLSAVSMILLLSFFKLLGGFIFCYTDVGLWWTTSYLWFLAVSQEFGEEMGAAKLFEAHWKNHENKEAKQHHAGLVKAQTNNGHVSHWLIPGWASQMDYWNDKNYQITNPKYIHWNLEHSHTLCLQ